MSALTPTDYIIIGSCFLGGIGTVLKAQHGLITRLLADKWQNHENRIVALEENREKVSGENRTMDVRMTKAEAICKFWTTPRSHE